jgi:hypothetical protein
MDVSMTSNLKFAVQLSLWPGSHPKQLHAGYNYVALMTDTLYILKGEPLSRIPSVWMAHSQWGQSFIYPYILDPQKYRPL